jgi:hypothetical protein
MDLTVDEKLFAIKTISSRTQFLQNKPPERPPKPALHSIVNDRNHVDDYMEVCYKRRYTFYSDDEKTRFFHLFSSKRLSASAAAKQLGIHIRAAQKWVKSYYENPESILEKKKNQDNIVFLERSISNFF